MASITPWWIGCRSSSASRSSPSEVGALLVENLLLRQQLTVALRTLQRPRVRWPDRLFWLVARRLVTNWRRQAHAVPVHGGGLRQPVDHVDGHSVAPGRPQVGPR